MPLRVRVGDLFQALRERLSLETLAGQPGLARTLLDERIDNDSDIIAGPLNYIHPNRIQVIGSAEAEYLNAPERNRKLAMENLFSNPTRAVLLVDGVESDAELEAWANKTETPLLRSPVSNKTALDNLQHFAATNLSVRTTLHGVFLEVLGMGVLITGDPAIGKSELALELITRGARLVADDAPEFTRIAPDVVSGECPPMLREFLEVRGLGILNIQAMFGDTSIKGNKYLRLIIHLRSMTDQEISAMERIKPQGDHRDVLGVQIPQVTIPVAPGRNLAVLVETAVRNHQLKLKGYDSAEAFIERQTEALEQAAKTDWLQH